MGKLAALHWMKNEVNNEPFGTGAHLNLDPPILQDTREMKCGLNDQGICFAGVDGEDSCCAMIAEAILFFLLNAVILHVDR